jgi:hypothetical protein
MKAALAAMSSNAVVYRLAIARFCLFSMVTLCGSIMTALAGTVWSESDNQTRFLIVISILSTWGGTILAFLDKSMKNAEEGKDPITGKTIPSFATQKQVDAGTSKDTVVSPSTLANLPPKSL